MPVASLGWPALGVFWGDAILPFYDDLFLEKNTLYHEMETLFFVTSTKGDTIQFLPRVSPFLATPLNYMYNCIIGLITISSHFCGSHCSLKAR